MWGGPPAGDSDLIPPSWSCAPGEVHAHVVKRVTGVTAPNALGTDAEKKTASEGTIQLRNERIRGERDSLLLNSFF